MDMGSWSKWHRSRGILGPALGAGKSVTTYCQAWLPGMVLAPEGGDRLGCGVKWPVFKSKFCHLLALWLQAEIESLYSSFLLCKNGLIMVSSSKGCWED